MKKTSRIIATILTLVVLATLASVSVFAEEPEGATIYYYNGLKWEEVYCYVWGEGGTIGENWPGLKLNELKGHEGWYSAVITSDIAINPMFNDGNGTQTANVEPADLDPTPGNVYWLIPGEDEISTAGGYAKGYTLTAFTSPEKGWPGTETADSNITTIVVIVIAIVAVAAISAGIIVFVKKKRRA